MRLVTCLTPYSYTVGVCSQRQACIAEWLFTTFCVDSSLVGPQGLPKYNPRQFDYSQGDVGAAEGYLEVAHDTHSHLTSLQ